MQLTPEFLKKLAIESFSHNTKIYFGESIPKFLVDNVDKMLHSDFAEPHKSQSSSSLPPK